MSKIETPSGAGTSAPLGGAPSEPDLLRVENAGKSFGGAIALHNVSFSLRIGRALGIIGENGAGKSTLMKILGGVYPAGSYEGDVYLRGEKVRFRNVQEARAAGVVLVPQELHIAPELSIAENMFAGALPSRGAFVDSETLELRAHTWLSFFGLELDPWLPASILSPSEQRLILIAGALSQEARVLILDEPTASLSDGEAQSLFAHVAKLRNKGIGVLFISHRLDDIAQVCDEVLVMRNGESVAFFPERNAPRGEIVQAMIGRGQDENVDRAPRDIGDKVALNVAALSVADPVDKSRIRVDKVSFDVRAGEIVGLFGLVGAGRTEILRTLFGTWPGGFEGTIEVDGAPYRPSTPRAAIRRRVAMLTEDRKQTGIFSGHSLMSNIDAAAPSQVSRYGFFDSSKDLDRALGIIKSLDVRARSASQSIETLSGGNQQKVLLGRWLATNPHVLLLDEPTAGVDVGAREEIYLQIEELARAGCAVLLVSSDLDEIMRMSDRTLVMYKGRITATIQGRPTRHALMTAATGGQ
ncbi:sugar ABC transporter ATP-binding protein [Cryobacterium tagatosivorans]|uniref:Sugar ABC transporter ATP-binding protein n=1 Tax=Cryobacterium tagatosivorans TaxID=1259199 RepID=A0A4R8UJS7_9MICO|nr:sugar ABC transporter ATP-binding protein [Cryobacterium tagatosivorans]TFB55977.1 sugar ABC transporter ATP-binding protein [Cryobacterium tagatosivorans]